MNAADDRAVLSTITTGYPSLSRVVDAVVDAWPEHARYARKTLGERSPALMKTSEILADAALVLAGNRLATVAGNYRWTCDRLREEELHFHREGRYRLATFEEADREVYSNADYMERYIDGLLLSQVLWFNHVSSCHFFFTETAPLLRTGARYLEIGPGHGLMMYLALRDFDLSAATAWDLSAVSIAQTREALRLLGFSNAAFSVRDIMSVSEDEADYDFVVLSEVLEHLEDPLAAMHQVRKLVDSNGLVFVNVPINSPSPDHIYLMRTPGDARRLLTETGFEIIREGCFATQNTPLERALKNQVSVSVCMLARPAG